MSDKPLKTVYFTVTTNAPGYSVTFEGEKLKFNEQHQASVQRPIGWDCIVYYELQGAEKGSTFKLEISEAPRPVNVTVETDSKSFFGFTGFVVSE